MSKLFSNNHITKKKVLEFLDKKGFYLVLFLCIAIITVTAYIVTKRNLSSYMDSSDYEAISGDNKSNPGLAANTPAANNTSNNETPNNKVKATNNQKVDTQQPAKTANKPIQNVNITLEYPVVGDIILDFAKNSLIFSKTLEQWTTHEGVDIASERGTPVKASIDGVVSDIYNDYKYGTTIIIDGGNGVKTKYSNLSTDSMVKEGAKVKKGDVISGVGNTAIFESGEASHLHFEVLQNGVNVNPKNFVK